jgi:hypothetical protein
LGKHRACTAEYRFDAVILHQRIWFVRLSVRIAACHAAETGSTPVQTASICTVRLAAKDNALSRRRSRVRIPYGVPGENMNKYQRLINNLYVNTGFTVIELFAMVGLMGYIAYVIYEFLIVFRSIHG